MIYTSIFIYRYSLLANYVPYWLFPTGQLSIAYCLLPVAHAMIFKTHLLTARAGYVAGIQRRHRFQQGGHRSLLAVSRRHAALLLRTHWLRLSEAGTARRPAPQRLGHAHTCAEALDERALLPPFIRARVRASPEPLTAHPTRRRAALAFL